MDENTKRWMLFLLLSLPVMLFWSHTQVRNQQAQQDERERIEQTAPRQTSQTDSQEQQQATAEQPETTQSLPPVVEEEGEAVELNTANYHVVFNTKGGVPHIWQITEPEFAKVAQADVDKAIKENIEPPVVGTFRPIDLIPRYDNIGDDRDWPLEVILKEAGGKYHDTLNRRVYQTDGPQGFFADDGTSHTRIVFTSPVTRDGLQLTKTYLFENDSYLVEVDFDLENIGVDGSAQTIAFDEPIQPGLGLTWGPGIGPEEWADSWDARLYKVLVNDGDTIRGEKFSKWDEATIRPLVEEWPAKKQQDWIWGMVDSRFYAATLVPDTPSPLIRGIVKPQHVPTSEEARDHMTPPTSVEIYGAPFRLGAGESKTIRYTLFAGPKQRSLLARIDDKHELGLHRTLFQSDWWLADNLIRPLALFMLWLLERCYAMTNSYGVAIILVVLIMRLLTQPFTHLGMKSQARVMAEQQRIKPLIDAINEKYKDDPQKKNAEIWKTYKEHGVNPLGMLKGCGWMLVQMPIFFALYRLLIGAIELRGASFLWIDDLTAPDALFTLPFALPLLGDKFNLLPLLMGVSQLFAQRLQTSNIQDPTQKQMATIMPIMFIFILYNFAAGLSLYWFVSNIWQIAFQIFVNKRVREEAEKKAHAAFEERQKAKDSGVPMPPPGRKKKNTKDPGFRDRVMNWLETKAKEAEKMQKKGGKHK